MGGDWVSLADFGSLVAANETEDDLFAALVNEWAVEVETNGRNEEDIPFPAKLSTEYLAKLLRSGKATAARALAHVWQQALAAHGVNVGQPAAPAGTPGAGPSNLAAFSSPSLNVTVCSRSGSTRAASVGRGKAFEVIGEVFSPPAAVLAEGPREVDGGGDEAPADDRQGPAAGPDAAGLPQLPLPGHLRPEAAVQGDHQAPGRDTDAGADVGPAVRNLHGAEGWREGDFQPEAPPGALGG